MLDNLFDVDQAFIELYPIEEPGVYRPGLKRFLRLWFAEHKIEYVFKMTSSTKGLIHIKDRQQAMLFKLRWM